ncbi:PfkB family carbohydrate kinase, partial [Endozoicomonas elysicola]|uniref:PfkB family carbohydrate kinase n=1 Tax=Endozoicomonas elysicola TaxID=305900 RepID=UPI001F34DAC2
MDSQQTTCRIACIGESMVELSPAENGLLKQAFAGDSLNTAIYIARMGSRTIEVSFITAVGTDHFSDRMIDFFHSENINRQWVVRLADKLPGLYAIELDQYGERSFSYWRNDSAARALFSHGLEEHQVAELAESFDLYYLSGISLAILDDHSRSLLKQVLIRAR